MQPNITRIFHKQKHSIPVVKGRRAEGVTWDRVIIVARSSLSKHKHHWGLGVEGGVCKLGTESVYSVTFQFHLQGRLLDEMMANSRPLNQIFYIVACIILRLIEVGLYILYMKLSR